MSKRTILSEKIILSQLLIQFIVFYTTQTRSLLFSPQYGSHPLI